jgi:predicted nucleic acid-binding protein
MIQMKTETLLLDSGVWVAMVDDEDPFGHASRELIADWDRQVGALDLTLYEVANVLGSKRRRLPVATAVCRKMEQRCTRRMVRADAHLIEVTVGIALEHGLTAYDAAYVAVARRHDWTLVSTDIRDLVSQGLAITPDAAV